MIIDHLALFKFLGGVSDAVEVVAPGLVDMCVVTLKEARSPCHFSLNEANSPCSFMNQEAASPCAFINQEAHPASKR